MLILNSINITEILAFKYYLILILFKINITFNIEKKINNTFACLQFTNVGQWTQNSLKFFINIIEM